MGRQRKDDGAARVTGAPAGREHRPDLRQGGMRAAGVAASRIAAPIVARRGGGVLVRLKAEWAAVVGNELAALTWPEALARDGALRLRVASHLAVELQHRAPLVIERINRYFGRPAVVRIVLVQGPLPLAAPLKEAPARPLEVEESRALDLRLDDIADPQLRAALAGLGRLVLAGERRGN
jgi:hypothetical protein